MYQLTKELKHTLTLL